MKTNYKCKKCGGVNIIYGSDFDEVYTRSSTTKCRDCGYRGKYNESLFDRIKEIKLNVFFSMFVIVCIEIGLCYAIWMMI